MIAPGECHVTKGIDRDMLWICYIILFLFSLQSAGLVQPQKKTYSIMIIAHLGYYKLHSNGNENKKRKKREKFSFSPHIYSLEDN